MGLTKVGAGVTGLDQSGQTSGLKMPTGSGAFSGTPVEGMMRNDTSQASEGSNSCMQHYNGTDWKNYVNTNPPVDVTYLAVAGGGGAQNNVAGGGGAGGLLTGTLVFNPGTTYTLTIGEGGSGVSNPSVPTSGSDSSITGSDITDVTVTGGGKGGDRSGNSAATGGSGGGGGAISGAAGLGAAGNTPSTTPSQGNSGGDGTNSSQ